MIMVMAMLLDAALGEPRWLWAHLPHPAIVMGRIVSWCDRCFNSGENLRAKGSAVTAALVLGGLILGYAIAALPDFGLIEIAVVAILLAQRSLVDHVSDVARALRLDLSSGQEAVAQIVGRDTASLDASGVARSAIESAAENLSDGVVAPIFWYMVLGLPGLIAYKAINTADSMIGYRTERHEKFGWAAARVDDVVNWIPARLTAAIIGLTHMRFDLFSKLSDDARRHRSPNAGWPEAAMAGVLDIAISGPRSYEGATRDEAFVNFEGRHDLGPDDIDDSVQVLWLVWATVLGIVFVIQLLS